MRSTDGRLSHRLAPWLVFALAAMACVIWSIFAGKDLNWDYGNYHLYLGRSVFLPRWEQDFLPASIQSYLNPLAYVPLAAMVEWGWRDAVIASVMAAIHSVNLLLIWLIGGRLIPAEWRCREGFRATAVALAALSPVFLQQVGGSFADVTTTIPFLFGYYLLVQAGESLGRRYWLGAGLALGVAVGMKLTNAPLAMGIGIAVFLTAGEDWRQRSTAALLVGMGSVVGFVAIHGYWGWKLLQEFGNPLFPFFNAVFQSPDYPQVSLKHFRFIQDSIASNLTYLFRMALPDRDIYVERGAPDVRMAVVCLLLVGLIGTQAWSRWHATWAWPRFKPHERFTVASFVLMVVAWLLSSGNGRYAMPLLLLLGPLVVWLWIRVTLSLRWSAYGVLLALLAQAGGVALGADFRWNVYPWGGQWVNVQMPKKLAAEPFLFLSLDMLSQSYLVGHLHPESALINVAGYYVIGPGAPGYSRLETLLRKHGGRVRMLISPRVIGADGRHIVELSAYDEAAARYGFEIDADDCQEIWVREAVDKLIYPVGGGESDGEKGAAPAGRMRGLGISCGLKPSTTKMIGYQAQIAIVDPVFDRLEDACPNLFRPRRPVTEIAGRQATRKYFDTDTWLWIQDGVATYHIASKGELFVSLGTVEDLMKADARVDCRPRFGRHFSRGDSGRLGS